MQYQVLVQNQPDRTFLASVIGIPECVAVGATKEEAIANAKTALEQHIAQGELVTIDLDPSPSTPDPWLKHMGLFADDPTFDDFTAEVAAYRQKMDQLNQPTQPAIES